MSISTLLFAGSTPIGSFIIGSMAESTGVQPTIATMGATCLIGVGVAVAYMRSVRDRLVPAGAEYDALQPSAPR